MSPTAAVQNHVKNSFSMPISPAIASHSQFDAAAIMQDQHSRMAAQRSIANSRSIGVNSRHTTHVPRDVANDRAMGAAGPGINQDLPISTQDKGRGSAVALTNKLTVHASGRPSNAREMGSNTSTPAVEGESLSVGSVRDPGHPKMLAQEAQLAEQNS